MKGTTAPHLWPQHRQERACGSSHSISPCPATLQNCSEYFRHRSSALCKQKEGTVIRCDHNLVMLIQIHYPNPAVANPWWYKWKEWTTDPWSYLQASWSWRFDYPHFRARLAFGIAPKNDSFQEYGSCFYAIEDFFFSVILDSFILNCTLLDNCSLSPLNFNRVKPSQGCEI